MTRINQISFHRSTILQLILSQAFLSEFQYIELIKAWDIKYKLNNIYVRLCNLRRVQLCSRLAFTTAVHRTDPIDQKYFTLPQYGETPCPYATMDTQLPPTERFIYYRKSVLHLLKQMFHVHLSRCITDLRYYMKRLQ